MRIRLVGPGPNYSPLCVCELDEWINYIVERPVAVWAGDGTIVLDHVHTAAGAKPSAADLE
jgi:hypothetical protein